MKNSNPSYLPVIAAIPNYNMASSLANLLPQLVTQGYDKIFVLDDASTDESKQIVDRFTDQVIWVSGESNLGSGGNRNRILVAHSENAIIHFIDADTNLLSKQMAKHAAIMMNQPDTGFVGGLVLEHGQQSIWNYGPTIRSFRSTIGGLLQHFFGTVQAPQPAWRRMIRLMMKPYLANMPDLTRDPKRRVTYWCHEASLLIKRDTLEKLGGFDPTIREHDIMVLAYRADLTGLTCYFDPAIAVEHTLVKIRNYNRNLRRLKTARYLRRKYGLQLWT